MAEVLENEMQWRGWNAQGFIPGPDETEVEFTKRVAFCQNLEEHLVQQTGTPFPFEKGDEAPRNILEEAFPLTEELYGIAPRWVPLFFSNHQLSPWHGGCAWIFQLDENTPTAAFLQLRSRFRQSSTYLGIYHRSELLAHELAHVGRMLYQEPRFEEMLAYQSSSSPLRRWLGPIVQSSKESLFFILLLGVVVMADFALFSIGPAMAGVVGWLKLAPLFLIMLALGRLSYLHHCFRRCLHRLEALYSPKTARHILYRLRDSEIKQFAASTPSQIKEFMDASSLKSFRWHFLKSLYSPIEN